MKTLILILTLAAAAAGQLICVNNDGSPVPPIDRKVNLTTGGVWQYDLFMPVSGRCVGAFTAYDASDDLNRTAANVLSKYVDRPKGDIEVLILDYFQYAAWLKGRSNSPLYSSRPQLSGRFAVDLDAGYYKLVLSNRHSKFAPKTVDLMIGWPPPKRSKKPARQKYRAP